MSVNMQHVFFEMLIYIQIRDYFLDNEGDADVAYNEIIRFYYLQGGSVFSPKTIFLNPFRPPELKHKTNKGAPQKVVAKPCKPLQILRTLQSNSQNETNTFASEKRNTKRTSYHDASNLIHNENSSIVSIYSNTNSQPLHNSHFSPNSFSYIPPFY
ncbi:hypothetical protein RhiirB3_475159 [Rhizophagus irregularis]|nr:hypothetical protein RhiirB3_475159 [Rhizophagus irregularis]